MAKLNEQEYSEIFTLPFQTIEYDLHELITVVDQAYDGYKVRITVPEDTKARGNAIRYGQCDIMMYNYQGKKDNDYMNLLYNGDATANVVTDDKSLTYSEELNWFYTDEDSNGDGELDLDYRYNPISPGEPVVFIAGEFAWMNGEQDATQYFGYPVDVEMPVANFKKMTPLHDNTPAKEIKGKMVTVEQFEARADELIEKKFGKYYR